MDQGEACARRIRVDDVDMWVATSGSGPPRDRPGVWLADTKRLGKISAADGGPVPRG